VRRPQKSWRLHCAYVIDAARCRLRSTRCSIPVTARPWGYWYASAAHRRGLKTLSSGTPAGTDNRSSHWHAMDRIYLIIMCASIVLLTTAFGLASPQADGVHSTQQVALLLRTIPR
jgi:hypothetical protein